jgi:Fe-S cluster biogenesis protein NfuA
VGRRWQRENTVIEEAAVAEALKEVRSLVEPDGGDIELVSLDGATGSVGLRLLLEGASCKECVMPRAFLEDVAADVLRKSVPGVARVSIDDPREHPGYVADAH